MHTELTLNFIIIYNVHSFALVQLHLCYNHTKKYTRKHEYILNG